MSDNANLYLLFHEAMLNNAGVDFLRIPGGPSIAYGQTHEQCGRMLSVLTSHGVKKGDRVVVQVGKSIEAVLLYLACLRAGAIYVPLNTAYTAAEVSYFIADAEPALFVCDPGLADKLDEQVRDTVPHILTLSTAGEGSMVEIAATRKPGQDIARCAATDLAAILYTSGTTGRSKGAMLSHGNLASNAQVLHQYWHFQHGDVLLHALPIFHVHGLFVALHCALLNGSTVWFLPKYDVHTVMQLLAESSVMMGVPTFYTRLLEQEGFGREQCTNMRLFISGSAPLLAETHVEFERRTGHRILERYGMTETNMITSNPYDGERVAGTVGYPLPGVSVRIAGDDGKLLPAGETGILEVKGPNVFSGYWRMPEKTSEEFRDDGWFITGDMAMQDEQGRVTIVGREKDLIISGGYNVYPKEIELVIDEIPGVKESAVIGAPHPDFGEAVIAVVITEDGVEMSEEDIIAPLSKSLARFKQPKHVFFLPQLPRNTMGKVQKNALRDQYQGVFQ
jgi:malonyl-CoA/methylmalonyl-CoA synthetase